MKKRFLHTMLRVGDLERSIGFYSDAMGMTQLRRFDNAEHGYTLVFMGYGQEEASTVLELTYNHDTSEYDLGSAYGHIAIGVEDCSAACDQIRKAGGRIVREPGPLKGGDDYIAFAEDPDGYRIELIERTADWF